MKRQGLNVTTKQLRKLADELDKQENDFYRNLKIKKTKYKRVSKFIWLIPIINHTTESDKLELEKCN